MFGKEAQCSLSRPEVEQAARDLLDRMTLREKVWLLNGNWDPLSAIAKGSDKLLSKPFVTNGLPRLGVLPIAFSDGPRGVVIGNSTCFPVSMARGASFDRALEARIGAAIGKELRGQGANYYGGVCVNLLRHPAWGRAQETYGEDPFHVGEMGKRLTLGVQAHNVMACVKHYAANNIENSRFFVDVKVDERALHEVYLPHFRKIVAPPSHGGAGAASVMGAYNKVNGEQACESARLLTEVLREDWGFEGFTMSDFIWGIRDGEKAIRAGLDVEMPFPVEYQRKLLAAVEQGRVPVAAVDLAALRILRTQLVFRNTPDPMRYDISLVASPEHIALAREAAEKSMVLIRNEGGVLPFSKQVKRVVVLGKLAGQENTGDHGSSWVHAPYVITPLEGLRRYLGDGVEVVHFDEAQLVTSEQVEAAKAAVRGAGCVVIVAGYDFSDEGEFLTPGNGNELLRRVMIAYRNMGRPFKALLMQLLAALMGRRPRRVEPVGNGGDRSSLSLKPEQRRMIEQLGTLNPNTAVCLVTGSMVLADAWDKRVPAVLYCWYAGMEGGTALARVLFGDVNPSGKLPFAVPRDAGQLAYFSSTDRTITYDLYHGYTLLDKCGVEPAYPFGFGLSYTTFEYSDLRVRREGEALNVRVNVSNTGSRAGEEVVQVYIGMDGSQVDRQVKLLKGFEKVAVPAGATVEAAISVPLDDLRYYDAAAKRWRLEPGRYRVMAGPSSDERDLLETSLELPAR